MKKIVGLLLVTFSLTACTSTNDKTEESSKSSTSTKSSVETTSSSVQSSQTKEKPVLGMNEDLVLGADGQITAKIKIVEATTNQSAFPEHMIGLDSYDTTKMIAVKIEYTNVSIDQPFLPYASYFQAFDSSGKTLKQVNQQNGQDAVSIGRTGTTQLFWELDVPGDECNNIEIDFVPSNKEATFQLTVSH